MNSAEPSATFVFFINLASGLLFVLFLLLPLLGYWFMFVDFRSYLRAMRRALVVITQAPRYAMPDWAKSHDPPYFRALGVQVGASELEVRQAYRRLAEQIHPDRGGDRKRFLALRGHFEDALAHVRSTTHRPP